MFLTEDKCCGCTACYAVCTKNCIKMVRNNEGFLYPYIDNDKCIGCNLCEKVCPILNKKNGSFPIRSVVIRAKNEETVLNSASGGFTTPLANYVIKNDGLVFGAILDDSNIVKHVKIDNTKNVHLIRGSKYVQSNLNNSYQEIREYLINGKQVLFIGTPCQVYGLKNFLLQDYENLITVDLVCKGVASPKFWGNYLRNKEKTENSKINHINFRKKNRGYHSTDMEIQFENNSIYAENKTDYFMRSYINSICMRKSCYQCNFKGLERCSDFTIFDAWHAAKYTSIKKDDDKGYTNVLIHTQKGEKVLNNISNQIFIYESNMEKAVEYDGIMISNSTEFKEQRNEFYEILDREGLNRTINLLLPVTANEILLDKLKKILYKLGLLNFIKKIKEKIHGKN